MTRLRERGYLSMGCAGKVQYKVVAHSVDIAVFSAEEPAMWGNSRAP
jgi:hypothetical protein